MRLSRLEVLGDVVGTSSSEDDDIEKRVGSESVGSVNGNTGGLSSGVESRDDDVVSILEREKGKKGECELRVSSLTSRREVRRTLSMVMASPVHLVGIPPMLKKRKKARQFSRLEGYSNRQSSKCRLTCSER